MKEIATILVGEKEIEIEYEHYPNEVGPRSEYTGLPIWVGKTIASGCLDGGTYMSVEAKCWLNEPYNFEQAKFIATGRLLKVFNLPTSLACQVKE